MHCTVHETNPDTVDQVTRSWMAGMLLAGMYMCVTNPDQIDLHGDPITLASQITTKALFSFQKKIHSTRHIESSNTCMKH